MGELGALETKALYGSRVGDSVLGALAGDSHSGLDESSLGVPGHNQSDVGGSYAVPDCYIRTFPNTVSYDD